MGWIFTPTDILKAEVISDVPSGHQRKCTDKWEGIEEELGRVRFERLFSHVRMIYAKDKLRKSLIAEFRDYVLNSCGGGEFVDRILEPYSKHYASVLHANYKSSDPEACEKVNSLLRYLSRVDHSSG